MLDTINQALLQQLSQNARMNISTLAARLGIARTTVQSRIERLEKSGIIKGYSVVLGKGHQVNTIHTAVLLSIQPSHQAEIILKLRKIPQLRQLHTTSGRVDLIAELACENTAQLDRILDQIGDWEGIQSSESLIYLSSKR